MSLEKYRPTMGREVLDLWAIDAQRKLDRLELIVSELSVYLDATYAMPKAGRDYLESLQWAIHL